MDVLVLAGMSRVLHKPLDVALVPDPFRHSWKRALRERQPEGPKSDPSTGNLGTRKRCSDRPKGVWVRV